MKKYLFFLLITPLLFASCSDDDDEPEDLNNYSLCNNFIMTSRKYSETEDLNQRVKIEFDNSFSIADWNDLKNMSDLNSWINCMNLKHDDSFMVTRNGEYFAGTKRQYYVHYSTDGLPYSGFLVHDKIGNFYLGSWYGISMNILAKKLN